ncbi:MAG: 50S ribosomal protein L31 [Thermoanaerobacteraceae bacterium]|nr:50S ribosomal protein L31 [Thermoanaerobacteraceae bacterium]
MKEGIHPKYYEDAVVKCACGNTFVTGSTKKEIHVEICSKCHPLYTGQQKLIDTGGRIDRFNKRYGMDKKKDEVKE